MNIGILTKPIMVASISSLLVAAPVRSELLAPVCCPGQTIQQSPDNYAVSIYGHQVSLLRKQVKQFLTLTDNWDGYGAVAPSQEAINNVVNLMSRLPDEWVLCLHQDDLTPSPYGTISLEWAKGDDYVSVEVGDALWAFTAEIAGSVMSHPNEIYPNEVLRQSVEKYLALLCPDAATHDASGYSA